MKKKFNSRKNRLKANNGKGNNPLRDSWKTPSKLISILQVQYKFGFDCCASKENTIAPYFCSLERPFESFDDILDCNAWMNPPFSIAWKMFEHFFKIIKKGVAIYRCDNLETGLWQKIIFPNADWIFIPNKRISYEGLDGDGARFPSALIGIGLDIPKGLKGTILHCWLWHWD